MVSPPPDPGSDPRAPARSRASRCSRCPRSSSSTSSSTRSAPRSTTRPCGARSRTRSTAGRSSTCCSTAACRCCRAWSAPTSSGSTPAFEGYAYDPAAAAAMLEEAGWTRGGDGVFAKDGPAAARSPSPSTAATAAAHHRPPDRRAGAARPASVLVPRPLSAERIFGSDLGAGRLLGADGGLRRPGRSERHRAARLRPDPLGGERLHRPERVPVERPRGRPPDAPLGPADRRRCPRRHARARAGDRGRGGAADPALPAAQHRRVRGGADRRAPEPQPGGGLLEQRGVVAGRGRPAAVRTVRAVARTSRGGCSSRCPLLWIVSVVSYLLLYRAADPVARLRRIPGRARGGRARGWSSSRASTRPGTRATGAG